MFAAVERKIARAARRTALSGGAALSFVVGIAFLTAAAWIYIAASVNAGIASIVIGAFYLGLGFLLLGLASAREKGAPAPVDASSGPEPKAPPPSNLPPLAQAFIYGMEAGAAARRRRPRR